ncbi:MAG: hypothetical protein IJC30_01115 [Alphaproteobacteria bacterium]|nr:hypothetical protein [Alphaproteobacteria bacterium]
MCKRPQMSRCRNWKNYETRCRTIICIELLVGIDEPVGFKSRRSHNRLAQKTQ